MTYIATTLTDQKVDLGEVYSTQINKSRETPADSLTAVFFVEKTYPEFKFIDVYTNKNEIFFSGIVDQQIFEVTDTGCFFTIKSRSKAAYLIDNEASPQTYKRPSLDIIFNRHIKPYGFTAINGDKSSFNTTIEVVSGMSEWDVLEKFCSLCLHTFPIVKPDGTIDVLGEANTNNILFSNTDGGLNYSSISQKYNRYKLISEITVCAPYAAIYVDKVKDQDSIDRGISRRKFISMAEDTTVSTLVSIETAEQMILEAKKKFHEILVKCPGAVYVQVGDKCQIKDGMLGHLKNLTVYETEYKLNRNGEFTIFTLLED